MLADRSRIRKQVTRPDTPTEATYYVGLGGDGQPLYEMTERLDDQQQRVREHLYFIYAGGYHNGRPFAVRIEQQTLDSEGEVLKYESQGHRY